MASVGKMTDSMALGYGFQNANAVIAWVAGDSDGAGVAGAKLWQRWRLWIAVISGGGMGRTVKPDLGQVKNCLRTRPNKHYYPPQCTDSMTDLVLLCLVGGCGSEDVRGYWFDYWDSIYHRLAMKKLTTTYRLSSKRLCFQILSRANVADGIDSRGESMSKCIDM